jgi:hypothetical protein
MRTEWMLAQKPKGDAWVDRTSSSERQDSEFLRLRESWCRLLEDLGLQYNFVAYEQLESGELMRGGYKVLILPRSTSLSAKEADAIRTFVAQGGVVLADGEPGVFDDHSRRLPEPSLRDLFPPGSTGPVSEHPFGSGRALQSRLDTLNYHQKRLVGTESDVHAAVQNILHKSDIKPLIQVLDGTGKPPVGIELHQFRNGGVTIVGLHTNPQLRVDELGPPEFKSNERFEKPHTVTLLLPGDMYVIDLRAGKTLGKHKELTVVVDPYEPTLFAVSAMEIPGLQTSAPASARRGDTVEIGMRTALATPAARHVFRVDCMAPDGKLIRHYSGNILGEQGRAAKLIPLAMNDPVGRWTVRVTDILSGQTRTATIDVH